MQRSEAIRNSTELLNLSYEYNRGSVGSLSGKTGHLTKIIDNLNTNKNGEYEFDALGRLTKAKGGTTGTLWNQTYSYDRYGNRTNVTASGTAADSSAIPLDGTPNLTYQDTSNRITTSGYDYDVAGNQTKGYAADGTTSLTYEYDAANRIAVIKKTSDGSYVQAFQYGSTNARLIDWDGPTGQNSFYCSVGGMVMAEYIEYTQNNPTWTKSYTYLGDTQLATVTPNGSGGETVEFNHPDRLGTRLKTDQSAGTSVEQAHLPFGTALNAESTLTNNKKRFTSYDRSSSTGLDYAINRTYDNKLGRFTQIDPIGMQAASLAAPQTLNMYSYCANDPINFIDPSGLFFGKLFKWIKKILKWVMLVITIVAAILTVAGAILGPIAMAAFAKTTLGGVLNWIANIPGLIGSKMFGGTATWLARGITLTEASASIATGIINSGLGWGILASARAAAGAVASNFQGSGKKYKTAQEAAIDFLKIYNPISIRRNREIVSYICRIKRGVYIFSKPVVLGTHGGSAPNNCPSGSQDAGRAHTHARHDGNLVTAFGDGNEVHSGTDMNAASSRQSPEWIATPSGDIHRYDPQTGVVATVSKLPRVGRTKRG